MAGSLRLLPFPLSSISTPSHAPLLTTNKFPSNNRPGGSCWVWKNSGPSSTGSFSFNIEDELDDFEFESRGTQTQKHRIWWFDDEEDDNWTDEEEEDKFWVFKIFRPFAWMLPAVGVSFLLGTGGPNAFLMALAVPLAQTALSLVIDNVWEGRNPSPKPRRRAKTKKRPSARASSQSKVDERGEESKTADERGSYQSWVVTKDATSKQAAAREPKFGGWDELDRTSNTVPRVRGRQNAYGRPMGENRGKLSKRGRIRDTPLLLRLLIAVFPFLGSWTKFLY